LILAAGVWFAAPAFAQRSGRGGPPPTGKAAAPVDLTGYWETEITNSDQWMLRMLTPRKGDYHGVYLTPAARNLADAWDPAKDEAAGEQCKSYGAPAIMHVPERLRITWEDDNTLRIDTDAGMQTRLLHFGAQPPQQTAAQLQGYSAARWDVEGGRGTESGAGSTSRIEGSSLKVVTTRMLPGYIYKNGIPYSGNAVMTEYFNRIDEPNSASYLIVTEILEDRESLTEPFVRTWHFKKLPDASGWNPTACTVK
jgi:hypothetical protein